MRFALLGLVVLAGCPIQGDECVVDGECESGEVCARDHACVAPDQVREARAVWTINGEPANTSRCEDRDLYIEFLSDRRDDRLGFQPVPCFTGQFTVDKLPIRFISVELGLQEGSVRDSSPLDRDGVATLDLRF